jgi:putative FmdB family regulatory protein
MPIYEFYCQRCNMIFNFFSRTVNTSKQPSCPKCQEPNLSRQVSRFAVTGRARETNEGEELPFDESRMERAMHTLAAEAERLDENDPRQAANLMRKLTDMTGVELGPGMHEALRRMEQGEDPEAVEAEMGNLLEGEEPFVLPDKRGGRGVAARGRPRRDEALYDL